MLTRYQPFCIEFRTDGSVSRVRSGSGVSDVGHFYDDPKWGFGGCVMARNEEHAESEIRNEINKRRLSQTLEDE